MVLNNVSLIDDSCINVQINGNKIADVSGTPVSYKTDPFQLNFDNALIFPGLINSHDHLDFNLFPQLGNKVYESYTEWGRHIHENYKDEIAKVLKVPLVLREQWGIIKNLLCGVTTVVNHGERVQTTNKLITVHEQYYCLHSVQFEKNWKLKLNDPSKRKLPVAIHVGEGRDEASHTEIDELLKWNILNKKLVGIHAVAMSDEQAKNFNAIVWCPESNYFLLDRTAHIKSLKDHTPILFGTDSTLTGNWDIWDHITLARKTGMLTDIELYNSLHINPATIWKVNSSEIKETQDADIVIAKKKEDKTGLNAFFDIEPKDILLVLHQGNIRFYDESLQSQLTQTDISGFSKININGTVKYIQGDVPALINTIKEYYPEANFPITIA